MGNKFLCMLLLFLLFIGSECTFTLQYQWNQAYGKKIIAVLRIGAIYFSGGTGSDFNYGIAIDPVNGDLVSIGTFGSADVNFCGTPISATSGVDIYVMRSNSVTGKRESILQ